MIFMNLPVFGGYKDCDLNDEMMSMIDIGSYHGHHFIIQIIVIQVAASPQKSIFIRTIRKICVPKKSI